MATRIDSCAQLLSLAVHEFRTPASVVTGYLRMLQHDSASPLNDRQRKMVDEAEKSCARLVALVAEMSELARLDAGQVTLIKEPIDLFALVREVAAGVHEAEERGVRLEVRGEATGAPMSGDAARLRSAFAAVFRAILREQPAACTVVAEVWSVTKDGANSAVIVVAERTSVQTAYASQPAMFDEKRGGLGLALPLARRIIETHGGSLWSPAGAAERGAAVVSLPLPELNC